MRGLAAVLLASVALTVLTLSCGRNAGRPTVGEVQWQLQARTSSLASLLRACSSLADDAPLARDCVRWARTLESRIEPSCDRVASQCTGVGCGVWEGLQCAPDATDDSEQADGISLSGPIAGSDRKLLGEFTVRAFESAAGWRAEVDLRQLAEDEDWWWMPERGELRAPRLKGDGAVLHARFRPRGGLDLGRLVRATGDTDAPVSTAERLYGLRDSLFSKALFEGTVEMVLLPPNEGGEFPGLAIAATVRSSGTVRSAMEGYLDTLQRQWPFVREEAQILGRRGTCLVDLRVLPELAPCYVLDDDELVLAWNRQVLEAVLVAPEDGLPSRGAVESVGRPLDDALAEADSLLATMDIERFRVANARLASARRATVGLPAETFAYRSATAYLSEHSDCCVVFGIELER